MHSIAGLYSSPKLRISPLQISSRSHSRGNPLLSVAKPAPKHLRRYQRGSQSTDGRSYPRLPPHARRYDNERNCPFKIDVTCRNRVKEPMCFTSASWRISSLRYVATYASNISLATCGLAGVHTNREVGELSTCGFPPAPPNDYCCRHWLGRETT